jgi:hypothetical protein
MLGARFSFTLLGAGDKEAFALDDFIATAFANLVVNAVGHKRQRDGAAHNVAYRDETYAALSVHGFVHEVYQVLGQLHAGERLGFLHGFSEHGDILCERKLGHSHGHVRCLFGCWGIQWMETAKRGQFYAFRRVKTTSPETHKSGTKSLKKLKSMKKAKTLKKLKSLKISMPKVLKSLKVLKSHGQKS